MLDIPSIARVCHEVNRAICEAAGDHSQQDWDHAPLWQKESAIKGVLFNLANPHAPASSSHDSWLAEKNATGWVYGEVKDVDAKTHPCMVPYEELPFDQKVKDHVFSAIVRTLG